MNVFNQINGFSFSGVSAGYLATARQSQKAMCKSVIFTWFLVKIQQLLKSVTFSGAVHIGLLRSIGWHALGAFICMDTCPAII